MFMLADNGTKNIKQVSDQKIWGVPNNSNWNLQLTWGYGITFNIEDQT